MIRSALLLLTVLAGCSGDPEPVECWLVSPSADGVVDGTIDVSIGFSGPARQFEVLVNDVVTVEADASSAVDSVITVTWDTTSTADGPVSLRARVVGDGSEEESDPINVVVDNTAPQASLDLERLSVIEGSFGVPVTIEETNVSEARLMIGDSTVASVTTDVAEIVWDTTNTRSGLHSIRLVVVDAAGRVAETEPLPVIVANNGYRLADDEVGYDPGEWVVTGEHTRITAAMNVPGTDPSNIVRVVTWLTWDPASAWRLQYSTGQGFCPERGVRYAVEDSDSGEIILDVAWAELGESLRAAAMRNVPTHPEDSEAFPFNDDPATCGAFFGHVNPLEANGNDIDIHVNFVFLYGEE
jgi:hypothetical protein